MTAVAHPRLAPRKSGGRASWWSKAMLRAVEESSYGERELRDGRRLARAGLLGSITVQEGSAHAAVLDGDDAWTVTCTLPVLDQTSAQTLVELIASRAGLIGALLSGELPLSFVEATEEAGVELLPYGGELGSSCSCEVWADPCHHALAVWTQLAWLVGSDPFVLTHLRGLAREEILGRLQQLTQTPADDGVSEYPEDPTRVDDLLVAEEAAARAAAILRSEGGA